MPDGTDDGKKPHRGLSDRAWANVESIMPSISAAVSERVKIDNPCIDLATAENWLIRSEGINICKTTMNEELKPDDLSYPRGFNGSPCILEALAKFFNEFFQPRIPVNQSHLATAPGAASCLDAILYHVCDPGDGILVPSPYWSGFDFQFKARASAVPLAVPVTPLSATMTEALLPALEKAYSSAHVPVKGLLMCNPQNPLGQCYTRGVIEKCMQFCQAKQIHYISDEVYALTRFDAHDVPYPIPFISALSIDLPTIGVDGERVHCFWSTSKDFGQSGIRMGCTVTQSNKEMAVGLALVSYPQTSVLSAIFVTSLLTSPDLGNLIRLNSERLSENYSLLTTVLGKHDVTYIPSYAGLYLYAQVCKPRPGEEISWEDEDAAVRLAKSEGVSISAGKGYHGHQDDCGWARIGFALEQPVMHEALARLDKFFSLLYQ